jgi:hypothetical protein
MRCLAANPNDRPQRVAEFLSAIRSIESDDE